MHLFDYDFLKDNQTEKGSSSAFAVKTQTQQQNVYIKIIKNKYLNKCILIYSAKIWWNHADCMLDTKLIRIEVCMYSLSKTHHSESSWCAVCPPPNNPQPEVT